jgi:hypothetical protein
MIVSSTLAGPGAELTIGDALRSVAPLVDSFLVILSGCDPEATTRVVSEVAAESRRVAHFEHLAWPNDYGKARNFALEAAERLGAEWALTIDTDERLEVAPEALQELAKAPEVNVWCVPDRDLLYQKPRFIRCGVGAKWWGICHERLTAPGVNAHLDGHFWELPKSLEAEARRWQRGLEACPIMLAERECPHIRRHYAECLLSAGRDAEARWQFELVEQSSGTPLWERTWCLYRLAEFQCVDGRYEDGRELAASALAQDPGFIQELGWVLAHCAAKLKEFQTAALWASYALQAPIDYSRGGHRGSTWREGCQALLARIQEAAERGPVEYTGEYFDDREQFRDDYAVVARALVETLSFGKHLDLGAGNGLLVEAMTAQSALSRGIEQAKEAWSHCSLDTADLIHFGYGLDSWGSSELWKLDFDLVSCVEVLEHIPAEQADAAVAAICSRSSRWVYFSAAQPGQGGPGHVNEQPLEYWRQKFVENGFEFQFTATNDFRLKLSHPETGVKRAYWLPTNALIFKRRAALA